MIRILGIDPGSRITGFGVIDFEKGHAIHVTHGCIRVEHKTPAEKLRCIFNDLEATITKYQPREAAIEKVFMYRNADSALKLGEARGVAIASCAIKGLSVFEYTANQVKQATVGKGHAGKQQVQHMVKILLNLGNSAQIPQEDAADALAIALCHAHSRENIMRMVGIRGIRKGRLV